MGNESLDTKANAQSSYSVISFTGAPENYRNMILSQWMRSLRQGNDYFKLIDSDAYYESYQKYIKHLINRPDCVLRVAVLSDDYDVVLGWSCMEGKTLHYIFVQRHQQGKGIAKALTASGFDVISHITRAGIKIWNEKYSGVKFDPFR